MKKSVSFVLAIVLALSLSACGGALVDLNTPKSGELSAQYDYYSDSMNDIRSSMKITPEQADDVFIALTASGLDGKVTKISEQKDGNATYFQVWQGLASYDVYLDGGAVSKIIQGQDVLYPESEVKAQEEARQAEADAQKAEAKSVALVTDTQAFQMVQNSEEIVVLLQQGIDAIANGGGSSLDLYDLAKTAKESQGKLSYSLLDLRDEQSEKYIDACKLYVANGHDFADKLMKYLDKSELKFLSEAKECIALSESYMFSVVSERSAYLTEQGFSDEEIVTMLTPESEPAE